MVAETKSSIMARIRLERRAKGFVPIGGWVHKDNEHRLTVYIERIEQERMKQGNNSEALGQS